MVANLTLVHSVPDREPVPLTGGDDSNARVNAREADKLLMRRVASGDQAAQRELMHRMLAQVRRISRALLRQTADAEDAAQLSLLAILRSAAGYRGEASIAAWADRIIVRTCMRYAREQTARSKALDGTADVGTVAATTHAHLGFEFLPRPVDAYLEALPEVQREAIVLRHALDYAVSEIAELTNSNENTIKARLLFARRTLRRLIRRDLAIGLRPAVRDA